MTEYGSSKSRVICRNLSIGISKFVTKMRCVLILATLLVLNEESNTFVLNADKYRNGYDGNTIKCPHQMFPIRKFGVCLPTEEHHYLTIEVNKRSHLCEDNDGAKLYGILPYRHDCRKFVQCGYGIEVITSCQAGLLYNAAQEHCDWPREANCIEFRGEDESKIVVPESEIQWK